MDLIGKKLVFVILISCPWFISGISVEYLYLNFIHRNLSDFASFNRFYQEFLRDIRQHRIIDTVSSPIDLEKLRSNHYTEDYLKNSVQYLASEKKKNLSNLEWNLHLVLRNRIWSAHCSWLQSKQSEFIFTRSANTSSSYSQYSQQFWLWTALPTHQTTSVSPWWLEKNYEHMTNIVFHFRMDRGFSFSCFNESHSFVGYVFCWWSFVSINIRRNISNNLHTCWE